MCPILARRNERSSLDANAIGKFLVSGWLMMLGGGSGEGGGENRSQREGRREGGKQAGPGPYEQHGTIGHVKRVGRLEKISHGAADTWHRYLQPVHR